MKSTTAISTLILAIAVGMTAPVAARDGDKPRGHAHDHRSHAVERHANRHGGKHDHLRPGRYVDHFESRQDRLLNRIDAGRRSGDITHQEARRLHKKHDRIDHMAERYARDGRLSHSERRRLSHAQDKASRGIAAARHNDRVSKGWHQRHDSPRERFAITWSYIN